MKRLLMIIFQGSTPNYQMALKACSMRKKEEDGFISVRLVKSDEEFPASVTCLFSANALSFIPLDGLADVAEYTSNKIIQAIRK